MSFRCRYEVNRAAVVASLASILCAASAKGQRADSAAVDTSARSLPEVVVRALRFPTGRVDAPYAVARNGSDVTSRARPGLSIDDALRGIAGVQVDNRFNFALGERLTVRGFGARTQFGIRGVRVLVDGIPATMPDGQTTLNHLDPASISAVEVVRTPLAALYGNAAGGVVSIETEALAQSKQEVAAVTGSDGLRRGQITVRGRHRRAAGGFSAGRMNYDGYRAHNRAENRYARARATTAIGVTSFDLAVHHVTYEALNPGALPDSMLRTRRDEAFPTNVAQRTGEDGEHTQAGLAIARALGSHTLRVTTYGLRRALDNPIPPRIIDLERHAVGTRVSVASPSESRVEWEGGVEAARQSDDRRNYVNSSGERGQVTLDQRERVRSRALFAAGRIRAAPRLIAQAGIRHDRVAFAADDHLVTPTNPDDSGDRVMREWSPSVGLSLRLRRSLTLFTNIGTSFETPTTTELANRSTGAGGFNPELQPQRTLTREAGINAAFGRAAAQLVWYRARVSDLLVPFEVPATPGRQFFRNAASAVHQGAELMVDAALTHGIRGRTSYAYTDARYREYSVGSTSFAGNRIAGVAPHLVHVALRAERKGAYADAEMRYQSRLAVDDANSIYSPAYALLELRGGIDEARLGGLTLSPYAGIENVLDRTYNTSVVINAAGGRFFEPGPGRTFFTGARVGRGRNAR